MPEGKLKTIAVDLTPVLPGGENGGAKIFVIELLRQLAAMCPDKRFVLLTQAASHDELATLDRSNVSRQLVLGAGPGSAGRNRLNSIGRRLLPHIPARLRGRVAGLGYRLNSAIKRRGAGSLLHGINADLLFCPFTAPTYHEQGIPTVCTIYDLQYKTYPEFFSPADVAHRDRTFQEARRRANAMAAISDYSRESAIRYGDLSPDRIRTIHLRMASRIAAPQAANPGLLARLGLERDCYLVYPANFWRHKNHEMLLAAFGMACHAGLPDGMKLVCTGAPGERQQYLVGAAAAMGLAERIVFPGFVPNDELGALLSNARGVIFPSLYEGFGLPVIEAMAAGVPVACSNLTSLPEVAADAAIMFDPRRPQQIAAAIISLARDDTLCRQLVDAGRRRAAEFADTARMAREYYELFQFAVREGGTENQITGIYPDGWCGTRLALSLAASPVDRVLEIEFSAPEWLPLARVRVHASIDRKPVGKVLDVARGSTRVLSVSLPGHVRLLVLDLDRSFVPAQQGISEDQRELALSVLRCAVRDSNGTVDALFPEPVAGPELAQGLQ